MAYRDNTIPGRRQLRPPSLIYTLLYGFKNNFSNTLVLLEVCVKSFRGQFIDACH